MDEIKSKESSWWRTNAITEEQKEMEAKSKVEKGRYLLALKKLVNEKGKSMGDGDLPSLCNCGAMA